MNSFTPGRAGSIVPRHSPLLRTQCQRDGGETTPAQGQGPSCPMEVSHFLPSHPHPLQGLLDQGQSFQESSPLSFGELASERGRIPFSPAQPPAGHRMGSLGARRLGHPNLGRQQLDKRTVMSHLHCPEGDCGVLRGVPTS